MELLNKQKNISGNPRDDNANKQQLFEEGRRPGTAAEHREQWSFIEDEGIRENISYQMQYLEFQVHLYNDYRMYLTLESLHFKNIMTVIGGIVESALNALLKQEADKSGYLFDDRMPFLKMIDSAYDLEIIDREQKDYFHALRKMRNLVHLSSIDYKEYSAYDIEETNRYIESLNRFIKHNGKIICD